jgi:hypothetical protein
MTRNSCAANDVIDHADQVGAANAGHGPKRVAMHVALCFSTCMTPGLSARAKGDFFGVANGMLPYVSACDGFTPSVCEVAQQSFVPAFITPLTILCAPALW